MPRVAELPIAGAAEPGEREARRPSLARLAYALFGGALAWAVQSIANYALVAHFCHPARVPLSQPAFAGTRVVVIGISVVLLAVSIGSLVVAWHAWNETRGRTEARSAGGAYAGIGWPHFIAFAGLLTATIFCFAIIMNAVPAFVGPLCVVAT